ncbi:MAG: prepilin-type N-terminal cleavage/methylation domain-containing protein [Candidatus Omnitrophota bacterium]
MKGFTLLEVMISLVILSVLIAGIFGVLNISDKTYHNDMGLLELQQQVRQAMDGMVKELKQSKASSITISNAGARIDFKVPTDLTTSPVTYTSFIAYYRSGNQILREFPAGTTKVLANDINALTFSLTGNMLQVQLSAQQTVRQRVLTFPLTGFLTQKVRLRNE